MMRLLAIPLNGIVLSYQSIVLALSQVWANKIRAVLTTLGILIGVGVVTFVIAALTGMKTYVLNEFESFGANKIFVGASWPETGRHANASWRIIRLLPEQFDGWETHCPSLEALTRVREMGGTLKRRDQTIENARVTGIEPDWHRVEDRVVVQGRPFSETDQNDARQVCLISEEVRDELRLDRDCTGQTILLNNRRFTVVGLLEPRPQSDMFRDSSSEAQIFIPFSTAWKLDDGWMHVMAICKSPEVALDASAELRVLLRRTRELRPDDPDTFRIHVMQEFIDNFKQMSRVITTIAVVIVAMSLVVGGVGIMNIMLVSVSERTREIGLRTAVGALPLAVLLQFLIEAVVLCCLGGLLGLAAGWLATIGLKNIPDLEFSDAYIPAWAIALAFGFSATVGITFGMFPAIKAALLDPIEALRHD